MPDKEEYDQRKAAGLCAVCGKPKEPGRENLILCEACNKRRTEDSRNRNARRRAALLCVRCGKQDEQTLAGKAQCAECLASKRGYEKKHRETCKAEKRCTVCGCQDARTLRGLTTCESCWAKEKGRKSKKAKPPKPPKETAQERYARHKANHECTICGKQDARTLSGSPVCEACSEVRNAAQREAYAKRTANRVCSRCGKQDSRILQGGRLCAECCAAAAKNRSCIADAPKIGTRRKTCDAPRPHVGACKVCFYRDRSMGTCDYYLIEHKRRPPKDADGCPAWKARGR